MLVSELALDLIQTGASLKRSAACSCALTRRRDAGAPQCGQSFDMGAGSGRTLQRFYLDWQSFF
jgi:hypothetical protein